MREAYTKLKIDKKLAPCVLVAGTNGKGSTSGFLAKFFSSRGDKVGLYTSPHLCHFRERIQCSHLNLKDSDLVENLLLLKEDLGLELFHRLSFFEVTTLLAFETFIKKQTDINIIEVGLGGRLDATNVIEPLASIIVSIGYDHEKILGTSKDIIFQEKLGITRSNSPLFLGFDPEQEDSSEKFAEAFHFKQKETGFTSYSYGCDFSLDEGKVLLNFHSGPIEIKIPSSVQRYSPVLQKNFVLALFAYSWIDSTPEKNRNFFKKIFSRFQESQFKPYSLTCRFQHLKIKLKSGREQKIILDVCHNVEAIKETCRTLKEQGTLAQHNKIPIFCSILSDKPVTKMLGYLQAFSKPLVLFSCSSERSFATTDLEKPFDALPFYKSFDKIIEEDHGLYASDAPWLICGSFFAIGEVLSLVQKSEIPTEF